MEPQMDVTLSELADNVNKVLDSVKSLTVYISTCEKELFDTSLIEATDSETLFSRYKVAIKRQMDVLEMARKIVAQAPAGQIDSELVQLAKMLQGLSKADLTVIKNGLSIPVHTQTIQ